MSITGGVAITICQAGVPRGASWGDDGSIVFATYAGELLRVSAGGGEPTVVTKPELVKGENYHWYPSVLPDGRGILFTVMANPFEPAQVAVLDPKTGRPKTLIRNGSQAEYVETGHLLYVEAGTLQAVRFDLGRLDVLSDPVPVADDVSVQESGASNYAVSRLGTLVYVPEARTAPLRSLVWVDRKGRETLIRAPQRVYSEAILSPDGTKVALSIRDQQRDIQILELASGNLMRLTFGPNVDDSPVWTSDSRRIVFSSRPTGASKNLYAQSTDGTGAVERLTIGPDSQSPAFVAPDWTGVLGSEISPRTSGDIVWFPFKSPASQPAQRTASDSSPSPVERLVHTPFIEFNPEISPDGRYIAYQSNELERNEI